MNANLKAKIVQFLFRKDEFFFTFAHRVDDENLQGGTIGTRELFFVGEILYNAIVKNEEIRNFVLAIAMRYLKRYEVDGKNFAEQILSKD